MFNLTICFTRRLMPLFCFAALFTTNTGAQIVQRNGLAEEFSSSSCHPCKDLYEEYHPATVSIGVNETDSHVNAVHYQINFPLPVDFSYNAHAQQRYDYYTVLGLPALKVNGKGIATSSSEALIYTALDTSRNAPAQFSIDGTYDIDNQNKTLDIKVNVKPLVSMTGKYRVHVAVTERHYTNPATTVNMPDYYHIMRRMFPDGNGKAEYSWTANTTKTYTYSAPYAVNNPPAVGSFDFWGNPFQSDVVVFVQDSLTRAILQSQVIKPGWPVSVAAVNKIANVSCFPNPARDYLHVGCTLDRNQEVQLSVTDITGRRMYTHTASLPAGAHTFNIPVTGFSAGIYYVQLSTGNDRVVRKCMVGR